MMAFSETAKRSLQSPAGQSFLAYTPTIYKGAAFGALAAVATITRDLAQHGGHSKVAMVSKIVGFLFIAYPILEVSVPKYLRTAAALTRQDWIKAGAATTSLTAVGSISSLIADHFLH